MRTMRQLSIREKLTLILASATLLLLLAAGTGLLIYQNLTVEQRARDYLEPYAQLLSMSASAAADFEDSARAQQILSSLKANPDILGASIVMQGGFVLAQYQRDSALPLPQVQAGEPEGILVNERGAALVQNIRNETGVIAQLHIWVSQSRLDSMARQGLWLFGSCALLLLLASLVLQKVIQKLIIRPITELAGTANLIRSEGTFDLRAKGDGNDEVAILAQSFNSMLDALQKLTGLQSAIVDHAPFAIISSDASGIITSFNPAAERLLGYKAEEMIGKHTPLRFHDPVEINERAQLLVRFLGKPVNASFEVFTVQTAKSQIDEEEWTVLHKDGRRISVLLSINAIQTKTDNAVRYLGMLMDITDRKRAEEELRRREIRFRTLIENSTDLITVVASDLSIHFQSPSCLRVLGFTQQNMVGHSALDFVHAEDHEKVKQLIRRALSAPGTQVSATFRLRHQDGSWRLIDSVGCCPEGSRDKGEVVINARDVTASSRLEEQLRQSQKLEAIGQLSGGVAHDFNNLLTVIQMHVDLLDECAALSAESRESISEIRNASERAANLTRQLLAFSRRQTMQLTHCDLNEIVSQMIRMLRRILGEDIQLQIHCSAQAAMIDADTGMMEQILLNLVVNSRDAMPSGGRLVIETEVAEISPEEAESTPSARSGSFVCMSVSDTGCGIAKEHLPKIFEPFFTTKEVGKGTGLGLATVYGIVQQHKGWISVYSEPGTGTTFRVYLPHLQVASAPETSSVLNQSMPTGTETILFVEDEPALKKMGVQILERIGYTVFAASNGQEALEQWSKHRERIELLVTDIVMPGGMSGRQLAEKIGQDKPDLKIVYCSGYSAEIAGKDLSLREGINFLRKPFRPLDLAKAVRSALDE